ncbi:MAG: ferredoxin [Pseudomonadota bacterium]
MYVILTSKPGQFRTEIGEGLRPAESYDYLFCGRCKARFVIAELLSDPTTTRVVVVDESGAPAVNRVPVKFLEKFDTVARARRELEHLTRFGSVDTVLVKT